jgi:hypothetical protein
MRGETKKAKLQSLLLLLFIFVKGGFHMLERDFQRKLIKDIKKRFPGAMVLKNDPGYIQGIPDLTIFYGDRWATLECKKSAKEKHQPNQDIYVDRMNKMSYSAFIYPENKEDILDEMERSFKA